MDPKAPELSTLKLEERGAAPLRLSLVVIGDGLFASHPLPDSGEVIIGRAENADVRIDDPSISRKHAVLHVGPTLAIEDLGSANGTTLRGARLAPKVHTEFHAGEAIEIGVVMIVVQRAAAGARPSRMWTHGYFEGRLEDECARAGRSKGMFAVVRVNVVRSVAHDAAKATELRDALARALRPGDIAATYAPDEYELLLVEAAPEEVELRVRALRVELERCATTAKAGVASYPKDGLSPEALIDAACRHVRGNGAKTTARSHAGENPIAAAAGPMRDLQGLARRIAVSTISVLLLGETGVGKEVMAAAMHRLSLRADQPFVRLNCGALTETLLESELFGHEKGSFTGAIAQKLGLLEAANGGTVFLDEVGELPLSTQVKLLRVLEAREVLRVGGLKPRSIDVRFVAATNRDLEAEIVRGTFRQDLYFRLNGVSLVIPPLRERPSEIEPLARAFLSQASRAANRPPQTLSAEALALLQRYGWPGNIRELHNVIERAALLADGDVIGTEHLPVDKMGPVHTPLPKAHAGSAHALAAAATGPMALRSELEALEHQRILDALASCAGNQSHAAKLLGISRGALLARLERYGMQRPRKRAPAAK